jgi:GH24 family phage-related lysozyme (muramidase)
MSITDQTNSMIQKNSLFDKEFLDYIKNAENEALLKTGMKLRHKSGEGGLDTVGYGHKLTETEDAIGEVYGYKLDTLTKEQADDILLRDLEKRNQLLINKLGKAYTNLDPKRKQMLLDIEFNVGDAPGVFPNFTKGVLENNIDVMKKEYERKFTDSKGEEKPLTRRNELFSNFFFGKN